MSNNHLVNAAGQRIVLRGADESGTEFTCIQEGTPTDRGWSIYGNQPLNQASTYQAMAAWHINVVRVPLNEDCWLGINGVNPAYAGLNYRNAIKAEVAAIHHAGMYVILDLHYSSPGTWAASFQQPMPDADHSPTFWASVATTFKSDPAVIFDLFNEPFLYSNYTANPDQDQWSCWLQGCDMSRFLTDGQVGPAGQSTGYTTAYNWKAVGVQQLVDAVRSTGATNPLLINGLQWAMDDTGWLAHAPTDPDHQVIVGAHMYPGDPCGTSITCWNAEFVPLSHWYPILFGEVGDSSAGPETLLPTLLPWADTLGISYLAWTWNAWSNPDDVLIQNWNGTPNAGEGTYYRAHLALVAPDQPSNS